MSPRRSAAAERARLRNDAEEYIRDAGANLLGCAEILEIFASALTGDQEDYLRRVLADEVVSRAAEITVLLGENDPPEARS